MAWRWRLIVRPGPAKGAIGSAAPTSTTGPAVSAALVQRAGPLDQVGRVIRSPRVLIQARKL